jgi:hypothetical protein
VGKDNQLSLVEKNDLQYNEGIIQKGLESWRQVSEALLTIRDGRLYRESHKSFEAYCRDRWNISRPRAYQLIGSSEVVKELPEKMSNMLDNPRQAAELAKVPTEKREKVIERTIEREGKLTAKAIKETARETAPVEVVEEEETPLPPGHSSWAMSHMEIVIARLEQIPDGDPDFDKAFEMLQEYFKSRGLSDLEICTPKPTKKSGSVRDNIMAEIDDQQSRAVNLLQAGWTLANPTTRDEFLNWVEDVKTSLAI